MDVMNERVMSKLESWRVCLQRRNSKYIIAFIAPLSASYKICRYNDVIMRDITEYQTSVISLYIR